MYEMRSESIVAASCGGNTGSNPVGSAKQNRSLVSRFIGLLISYKTEGIESLPGRPFRLSSLAIRRSALEN